METEQSTSKPLRSRIWRWLQRTPVHTFVFCPLAVIAVELVLRRGSLAFVPWGTPLLLWGYLQYRFVGGYRHPRAGGTTGMDVPPDRIVDSGPYRFTRNPMYLGHLIFMLGLAITFWSVFALLLLAARAIWFHRRVRHDEERLHALFGAEYDVYCARVKRWIPGVLLAALVLLHGGGAQAAEIKALITTAMKAAIDELVPEFERASAHKVLVTHGPSGALAKRVTDGEAVDLIVVAGGIEELVRQGKVAAMSSVNVAKARIGVAVRKGAPKPDIATTEAFKRALLAAKSVAYVDPAAGGASGIYLAKMLERIGVAAEVNAKARLARGGTADMVSAIVARGDAEIGLQQIPEIMSVAGVDLVGPLPDELQTVTVYTAGVPNSAGRADAAAALVKFLTAPAAALIYKAKGLDPG